MACNDCNPVSLNLAQTKGFSTPLPHKQDCEDIVLPDNGGRVARIAFPRPGAVDRHCCVSSTPPVLPNFGFANQAPHVVAGTYDPFVPFGGFDFVIFDPLVTDDGQPNGAVTLLWEKISGPGAVVFDDATRGDTAAHFSVPGTYVLRLTASDGEASSFDTTTITVLDNQPPEVDAGLGGTFDLVDGSYTFVPIDATSSDDGRPNAILAFTWELLTGPGEVVFDLVSDPHTAMHFTVPGTYHLQLTAFDGLLSATDTMDVVINSLANPNITFQPSGVGCIVFSSPAGINLDVGSTPVTVNPFPAGAVVTLVFRDLGYRTFSGFHLNGVLFTPVVTHDPDPLVSGDPSLYTYVLTVLNVPMLITLFSVPNDF